ncbi:hypothetical protein Ciccas_004953 [Cichlidogyrus casuarinus]|uniref:Uncharacterized protein n=1 Tax=Cichlidogyrus casuarinus TaxID=1844966 RepID=A0ABD2QA42_9PLAT
MTQKHKHHRKPDLSSVPVQAVHKKRERREEVEIDQNLKEEREPEPDSKRLAVDIPQRNLQSTATSPRSSGDQLEYPVSNSPSPARLKRPTTSFSNEPSIQCAITSEMTAHSSSTPVISPLMLHQVLAPPPAHGLLRPEHRVAHSYEQTRFYYRPPAPASFERQVYGYRPGASSLPIKSYEEPESLIPLNLSCKKPIHSDPVPNMDYGRDSAALRYHLPSPRLNQPRVGRPPLNRTQPPRPQRSVSLYQPRLSPRPVPVTGLYQPLFPHRSHRTGSHGKNWANAHVRCAWYIFNQWEKSQVKDHPYQPQFGPGFPIQPNTLTHGNFLRPLARPFSLTMLLGPVLQQPGRKISKPMQARPILNTPEPRMPPPPANMTPDQLENFFSMMQYFISQAQQHQMPNPYVQNPGPRAMAPSNPQQSFMDAFRMMFSMYTGSLQHQQQPHNQPHQRTATAWDQQSYQSPQLPQNPYMQYPPKNPTGS